MYFQQGSRNLIKVTFGWQELASFPEEYEIEPKLNIELNILNLVQARPNLASKKLVK